MTIATSMPALSDGIKTMTPHERLASTGLECPQEHSFSELGAGGNNIIGIFIWNLSGEIVEANDAFLQLLGHSREDVVAGRVRWTELTPAEWGDDLHRAVAVLKASGTSQAYEKEYLRRDGSRVPVLVGAAPFGQRRDQGVAFVVDLSEVKRADEELRKAQLQLAYANRVATMGEITASIAHEVKQPIMAIVANAQAALRWLVGQPPDLKEVRQALGRVVEASKRADEIIDRIRDLLKKAPPRQAYLDINGVIREVIGLTRCEAEKRGVSVQTELAENLPLVQGDRVQLQQVVLNLILNAVQAIGPVADGARELLITTSRAGPHRVLVAVKDSGPGLAPASVERVFEPFYTTKPDGLGIGLSICRWIIEAHSGRFWVTANVPRGAIFHFTVPTH